MSPFLLMVISNILNFVLLLFLLNKFVVPKLGAMIVGKQEAIAHAIDEAEKNLADVEQELVVVRREMQQTETQIAEIHREAASRGIAAAEKLKSDTEVEIEQLRQRVERQIEQEFSNLRLRLRQDLIQQVMLKAEGLIRTQTDTQLQTQLVENFAYSLKDFKEFKS
ncbi:MAG: hypothetical protein CVV27_12135 [Candidatus Melainabacteria bacterium HGW-Melainabacteria-1]|nr:MAG: hypothetical protein CVV27_12135 [Candidatus Melainabacteria bacterium HGW-Melainabacteria-1]